MTSRRSMSPLPRSRTPRGARSSTFSAAVPKRAGELAASVGMSGPAMSRHLRVLRESGLVEAELVDNDARLRMYHLRPQSLVALQAWLDQVEAFWSEQLGSFKAHAERTRKKPR